MLTFSDESAVISHLLANVDVWLLLFILLRRHFLDAIEESLLHVYRIGINLLEAHYKHLTVLGQYWHTVSTFGDRREPGSKLELVPTPMTNSKSKNLSIPANHQTPLPTDQAISLLRAQLQEPVEDLHHDDPEVDSWERVTHRIVERAFGERSRNANHFAVTLSYARQPENEKQAWHVKHIREKKGLLRAFIKELEIIPPHHPQAQDDRFARMAVDEARKSAAEDDRAHPMVGCIVVKDGQLLGTAHRGETEGNHAEFIALEKKLGEVALTGCTVYTTLEPCTTRNHPKIPCADRLIERKVARVVIGTLDPNPEICGKGIWKLQQANIAVEMFPHALTMELNELNRHFFRSFAEPRAAANQIQKGKDQLVLEKRKLFNLVRKIECIECDFRFPPGPRDAVFNGYLINQINRDIENARDSLIELLDLPEARMLAEIRIPAPPVNGASWEWLESTWRKYFLPVQELFQKLKVEVFGD